MIAGVELHPLGVRGDARGAVLHMLRADAPGFDRFGEIYFSEINAGVVKAWKRHLRTTQRIAVPAGRVRFVLVDDRSESTTRGAIVEHELGRPDAYALLVIPPLVWYGWKCLSAAPALVANCPNQPHDPAEQEHASEPALSIGGLAEYRW